MDRSTTLDAQGKLRMRHCPFSREEFRLPVFPCNAIKDKLKAWEAERMNRCVDLAEKMIESKEWERATKVFDVSQTILEEMNDDTYLDTAKKLANLERQIPFIRTMWNGL